MGFQLHRASNAAEAIAGADDPQLRLFTVSHGAEDEPQTDVGGQWRASTSSTASNFSAVAWFFGRDLRRALKVPVGLMDSSVGGTPAEAWTPREALEKNPDLKKILERHAEAVRKYDPTKAKEEYDRATKKHAEAVKNPKAEGKTSPTPSHSADRSCPRQ